MKVYTGTSGFSYKEWIGSFYPNEIKPAEMLHYYALHLCTVEINNTFYRMPKKEVVEHWKAETPEHFLFSIKVSQRITHRKRLSDAQDETQFLLGNLSVLGEKLGALLYQFPPYFKKNPDLLSGYLEILPEGTPAVFEFRNPSWYDDEIAALLAKRNFSFCFSETDGKETPEIRSTGDWGYLRLRKESYTDKDLSSWVEAIKAQNWKKALVFIMHEDNAFEVAKRFEGMFSGKGGKAAA